MSMDRDRLYELTMQAIAAAMNGDSHGAADAVCEIGEAGGDNAIYGACCAFAEVGRAALAKIYGEHAPDTSRGGLWAMQQLSNKSDPYDLFACRFIVAHANGDTAQAMALFNASIAAGNDDHVSSVSALLGNAVQLANTATRP